MVMVSACLAGYPCRYDGKANPREDIIALVREGKAIPICPEQLSGMTTPRTPCEVQEDGSVISRDGQDVTDTFREGARVTLGICKLYGISVAILKSRSPSCGCGEIYDGSFSGKKITGMGVAAKMLQENGIVVASRE